MDGLSASGSDLLPVWLTRFFGRQAEIADLGELVESSRLLTLVGPPGVGKTRLGVELATRLEPRFGDGVWFVELAPVSDPMLVANAAAAAAGTPGEPGRPMVDTLVEALAGVKGLVVLDNCEHLVDATAAFVDRLLSVCPTLWVVATSRVPLGVHGEQVWRVRPLDAAASVELFADRARLASGGFEVDDATAPVVGEICDRVAGLPLAIELAAAWIRVLSPGQILDRLGDALGLLQSESRGVSPRQATMDATVGWSYQLLGQREKTLFDQLSVFVEGFDLEAARAVADADRGDEHRVLQGLAGLVDQSLVLADETASGPMRYRLLEPVRQYGAARLAARGDGEIVRRRHAEHYLAVALGCDVELRGGQRTGALERLKLDEGNLFLALTWASVHRPELGLRLCSALALFWELRGWVTVGRTWLERMLRVEVADRQLRASALARAGRLAWRQRDYRQARQLLEQSLAIKRELGDELGVARRLRSLALVTMTEGDVDAAVQLCEESIASFRAQGDDPGLVWALLFLGLALYIAGDQAGGDARIGEALALNENVGSRAATAYGLLYLCYGAKLAADVTAERDCLVAAIAAMHDASGLLEEPDWLWAGTSLALSEGRKHTAFRLAGGADALSRRVGSYMNEQFTNVLASGLDELAGALGPGVVDRLRAEGARMSLTELLGEAVSREPDGNADQPLSAREQEVTALVAEGLTNSEIAARLFISRRTVESHLDHIRQKLDLRTRRQVMAWSLHRTAATEDP
ncbi:MAG: ATP-binding protein [Acidimicrobiales bacterium]